MKKVIASLLTIVFLAGVAFAGAINAYSGFDTKQKPTDIYNVKLGTGFGTNDTIATGASVRYGPYPLSIDPSRPMFKYLRFVAPIGALVSDSLACAYQMLPSNVISDTGAVTTWVSVDTLQPGEFGTAVDISAKVGQSIVFRLLNTSGATAIIRKPLRVLLKEPTTETVDVKR